MMPTCDHKTMLGTCKNTPTRAPRLIVPSRTPLACGHRPLRLFTTLHYCELHKGEVSAEDLLRPRVKADFEALARRARPLDFKCDFEAAWIDYVLTTTPEYRRFEQGLRASGAMLQAALMNYGAGGLAA